MERPKIATYPQLMWRSVDTLQEKRAWLNALGITNAKIATQPQLMWYNELGDGVREGRHPGRAELRDATGNNVLVITGGKQKSATA